MHLQEHEEEEEVVEHVGVDMEERNEKSDVEPSEDEVEEDSDSSSPDLMPIKIDGKHYYIDEDQTVYAETEDGYEQVGKYNTITKKLTIDEDSEESDTETDVEEEGEIEVEDFVYKGKTYQRDGDNNIYLDGEQIGVWNGKRIVV